MATRRGGEGGEGRRVFAALSSSGAAFAQLQTNARAADLWRRAQDLEDAALAAWEQCGEDDGVWAPRRDDDAPAMTPPRPTPPFLSGAPRRRLARMRVEKTKCLFDEA